MDKVIQNSGSMKKVLIISVYVASALVNTSLYFNILEFQMGFCLSFDTFFST